MEGSLQPMSELRSQEKPATAPMEAPPVHFDARREMAARHLFGEGLEIGPLHQPLALPPQAKARYVDRMKVDALRSEYPELAEWNLTEVDVVDDGELLSTIPEESQDFIIANHFLEHCENPISTIGTHLGKLKPGGALFYAVPDKRFTFDFRRPVTPLSHMVADFEEGPARSRREHYEEWTRLVIIEGGESPEQTNARARALEEAAYSIHMHVWTQGEFLRMILDCRDRFDGEFDIEAAAQQGIEFIVLLRKAGPQARPLPAPTPAQHRSISARLKRRARSALGRSGARP
jgi:SAM-dependent methyltransferase